jgi:hypothetical protein
MGNPASTVNDFTFTLEEDDNTKPECKGQIYKASVSSFIGAQGDVVDKIVFRPQKRKSCSGCDQCGYLLDDLREAIACDIFIFPKNPVQGKLYKLAIINMSRNYETGMIDEWDTTFIPLEG